MRARNSGARGYANTYTPVAHSLQHTRLLLYLFFATALRKRRLLAYVTARSSAIERSPDKLRGNFSGGRKREGGRRKVVGCKAAWNFYTRLIRKVARVLFVLLEKEKKKTLTYDIRGTISSSRASARKRSRSATKAPLPGEKSFKNLRIVRRNKRDLSQESKESNLT